MHFISRSSPTFFTLTWSLTSWIRQSFPSLLGACVCVYSLHTDVCAFSDHTTGTCYRHCETTILFLKACVEALHQTLSDFIVRLWGSSVLTISIIIKFIIIQILYPQSVHQCVEEVLSARHEAHVTVVSKGNWFLASVAVSKCFLNSTSYARSYVFSR